MPAICGNAEILSAIRLVEVILNIIRFVIPGLLVFSFTIDLLDAARRRNDDKFRIAKKSAYKKSVAAIIIFLIPFMARAAIVLIDENSSYEDCRPYAVAENINAANIKEANRLLSIMRKERSNDYYDETKKVINKISTAEIKTKYLNELEALGYTIEATKLIDKADQSLYENDYQEAMMAAAKVRDANYKSELDKRLLNIQYKMKVYSKNYSSSGSVKNPLGLPYYNQCDNRWGKFQYDKSGATLCDSANGYAAFAMIASGLTHDQSITPYSVIAKMRGTLPSNKGYGAASPAELTNAAFMNSYHLKAQIISTTEPSIMKALNQKKAVILQTPGHYIVLTSSYTLGSVTVLDSFSSWDKNKLNIRNRGSGIKTLSEIKKAYGGFRWAAAYSTTK
jgi:hypothetical protein